MRTTWILVPLVLAAWPAAAACRRTDAAELVRRCFDVSPATHPPCNTANACSLIISEIRRGCGLLPDKDKPGFCRAYAD